MEFASKANSLRTRLGGKNRGAVLLWVFVIIIIVVLLVMFGVVSFSGDDVIDVSTEPTQVMPMEPATETTETVTSPVTSPQMPPPAPAPASPVNTNTLPEG